MTLIVNGPKTTQDQQQRAQESGAEAQGYALAQSAIGEAKHAGNTWLRYVAKLYDMATDARDAFLKELRKHQREMRAYVKDAEERQLPDAEVYAKANRSAGTKFAELMAIATAMNAGYRPTIREENGIISRHPVTKDVICVDSFYTIVAEARVFKGSDAKGRGRPQTPWLDKLKKFLDANQDQFAQRIDDTVQFIEQRAALTKKALKAAEQLKKD